MNKKKIMFLHIICPIVFGTLIYCLISPDLIFAEKTVDFIGIQIDCAFLRLVRNYLPDMMWGYSLIFSLFCIIGNHAADVRIVCGLAVPFTAAMEIMQKTSFVPGTFDIFDIFSEILAEVIAVCIIYKLYAREEF